MGASHSKKSDSKKDFEDTQVRASIQRELQRQQNSLELIASENFVSPEVLQAQGSVLTNKYAEGYPGKRYYGGCTYVDEVERLAIERACQLFQCAYANVQPHSGSQANQAVFLAFLKPGDCVLSLSLAEGGHLTHGSSVNLSGKWFSPVFYGLDPVTHRLNFETIREMALTHRPKLIIAGASAYPRQIDFAQFRAIADEVGAILMADIAHIAGLVAAGLHPHPFPHAHVVTTTTHKTLRGPRGGMILTQDLALAKKIDQAIFPGLQGGPLMHIIAAKAVCFAEALLPSFKTYAQQILLNAQALTNALIQQKIPIISGGTDNHLMLVDLRGLGLSGLAAEHLLEAVGITCNKNAIPQDPLPPQQTSGIRLGTPAITTRGLNGEDCAEVGGWIAQILHNPTDPSLATKITDSVLKMCARYPLPY